MKMSINTLSELRDVIDKAIAEYGGDTEVIVTALYGAYGSIMDVELFDNNYPRGLCGVYCLVTDIMTG